MVTVAYKRTRVGTIPGDWDVHELGSIGESLIGLTYSPMDVNASGIIVLRSSNIQSDMLSLEDCVFVSTEVPDRIMVQEGDILICVRNGSRALIGKCIRLDERARGMTFGAFMAVFRTPLNAIVYHHFRSELVKRQIHEHLGATINQITNKSLNAFVVPLPPTQDEREAIAEALSDADALIEALEQLLAKKRQIRQGAMQELLTGRRRLPGFAGKWKTRHLGDLFTFSGGYTASRAQLSTNGYCYLHYGDIHTATRTFVDVCAEYQDIPKLDIPLNRVRPGSLLEDGDVVFVDASEDAEGTSKHVVVKNANGVPFIAGLHTIVAKGRTEELTHSYRRFCFQTSDIRRQFQFYAVGTKVSGMSKSNIVKLTIPVPSTEEQSAIATILSDMDAEIDALEARLTKARQIKQGMMQELLTGRIRLV